MPRSGPFSSLAEYFTLRRALDVHAKLPAPARESLAGSLSLGHQRADAAEVLWANGHAAEGLRLAIEALEASATAAREYALAIGTPVHGSVGAPTTTAESSESTPALAGDASEPASPASGAEVPSVADDAELESAFPAPDPVSVRASALRARSVSPSRIRVVEEGLSAARSALPPALDAGIGAAESERFRRIMDAQRVLDRAFSSVALGRRELQLARVARIGTTAFLTIAVVIGSYFMLRTPEGIFVESSGVWANAPAFAESMVIDGRTDTWWLAPDGSPGWVEVRMSPARRIEHVTLLNSANPPHGDRATRDYRLEIYADGALARSIDGTFEHSMSPEPVTHDVAVDDVERIRFVARTHHRTGAGLTELSWD